MGNSRIVNEAALVIEDHWPRRAMSCQAPVICSCKANGQFRRFDTQSQWALHVARSIADCVFEHMALANLLKARND